MTLATGAKCTARLEGHTDGVRTLAVRGDLLISGSFDRTVRVSVVD